MKQNALQYQLNRKTEQKSVYTERMCVYCLIRVKLPHYAATFLVSICFNYMAFLSLPDFKIYVALICLKAMLRVAWTDEALLQQPFCRCN